MIFLQLHISLKFHLYGYSNSRVSRYFHTKVDIIYVSIISIHCVFIAYQEIMLWFSGQIYDTNEKSH